MSLLNISRDKMLGALLVGTYANSFLYILEVVEVIKYFRYFSFRDQPFLKAVVLLALIIDTLDTAAADGIVYLNTITHWGDEAYLNTRSLLIPIFVIFTGVSAIISRIYLSLRYWQITEKRRPSILLMLTNLPFVAGTALLAVTMANDSSFDERSQLRVPAIFWLAASTVSDLIIVIALLVVSHRGRVLFSYFSFGFPRFCSVMLRTGVVGALFSVAALTVYSLGKQETNLSFPIIISLGRVYAHAILRDLNSRGAEAAGARQSLPHTVQFASYPFMPRTSGTGTPSGSETETPKVMLGLKGGRSFISPPVLVADPTPENLMAGITFLKQGVRTAESPAVSQLRFLE